MKYYDAIEKNFAFAVLVRVLVIVCRCVIVVVKMSEKSKKRAFTMHEKFTIISEIEKGTSQADICVKMKLKKSTVSNIWKNREKIKNDWKINDKKKKMRTSSHPQVDELLFRWFQQKRANNFPVSGPMLQMKAEEFGKMIKDDFKCSSGWLDRFKKRHNIVFGKVCGESASVHRNVTDDWISQVWPAISKDYSADDIFNADETGIFYRMMPDKTHRIKGETCSGGKMSKDRITAMVCANSSGTEKRKLFVIGKFFFKLTIMYLCDVSFSGKFQNPRCLKNVKTLPVDYRGNNKAWMTSSIFIDYLKKWDRELITKRRKILLLVDNCPAHPNVKLHNINLHFFPPNATSVLQPMDQGVIWSLKQVYRKLLLMQIMDLPEETSLIKAVTLLNAVNLLSVAWESVSSETISNCFRHAGLVKNNNSEATHFDPEDNIPLSELVKINSIMVLNKFNEYVRVDENVVATEELSDNELVQDLLQEPQEEDTEDQEVEEHEIVITSDEAINSIKKLQKYFQQKDNSNDTISLLNKVELILQKDYVNKPFIQTKLTSFFQNL